VLLINQILSFVFVMTVYTVHSKTRKQANKNVNLITIRLHKYAK